MSESTTPRLMPAAKEFNIGKDTLIDFLVSKGFSKEELSPTAKLTEPMYKALQQEFSSDKAAKIKSDAIDLPKAAEAKKRKDEENISIKEKVKKVEPEVAAPVATTAPEPTKPIPEHVAIEIPKVAAPIVVEQPKPQPIVEAPLVEQPKAPTVVAEELTKITAPEVEQPKVLGTIDLSTIDSSTKPKKGTKKKEEIGRASCRERV